MLLSYLRQLQAHGQTHIAVTPAAREVLRECYRGNLSFGTAEDHSRPKTQETAPRQEKPAPRQTKPAPTLEITGDSPAERLTSLREQIGDWQPLKELGSVRPTLVFSQGPPHAALMMIGEAPRYHDEIARAPFSGPTGEKLNAIFKAMQIPREDVYLTNICKHRPAMPNQTSNNRRARPEEIALYLPFLKAEVEILQPKLIVAFGAAAQALLANDAPIDDLRGRWHEFAGIPLRASQHPSFLLMEDQDILHEKRKVWEDMLVVMETLGLPVSEKQKSYFTKKS
jgi:DNA polymerase